MNGSITSNVTVTSPGILGGTGTITGNVAGTGTVAPGTSPGVLTINGNFTPGGLVELEAASPYTTAGTHFDQVVVNGAVNLSGATLSFVGAGGVATAGQVVTFIANDLADATTSGTPANGSIVTLGGQQFTLQYNGGDGNDVVLVAVTAGITVSPTAGLVTTEAGGTAQFTVVLTSQPTADVTIGLTSSDPTEGTVSAASVTFTAANWNVAQTVTVTGVDDFLDDGDIAYTIVTAAAVSGDPGYSGLNGADVSLTNSDNDTAGITVSPTAGLVTTEAGGTAQFTVVLTSQPTADVTIGLTSSDLTEGTVSAASVTFTAANWNVAQTVTVTGVDDFLDDGDIAYTIVTAAAVSGDPGYSGLNGADVSLTNSDNDTAGITVSPTAGLVTTEAGGTAQFTVVLTSQPTADVTIGLTSSDLSEGTVSAASVTFTPANWNVAQTVTVTGVDDFLDDGDIAYTIVTAAAVSGDPGYSGLNGADVSLSNSDNDGVRDHGQPDDGPDDDGGRGDGPVHGGADQPADGRRDDRPDVERSERRDGLGGQRDVHTGQLERGPDGDGHGSG